jgi:hypothetical protein
VGGVRRETAYRARERAFTSKNIKAGFAAGGLFPFDPDRVLRDIPKAPAELTIPKADKVKVGRCPQDEAPQTPVTPVSAEGLMSLQNLIIKQDAHALDETSKQSLQRHLHKFAKAAQTSFAKSVLQQNQIRFLITINNEAKVRRSTKSVILGKAKVMSYEDLEEARAKRAEKEAAKEAKGKGKRGRKPKDGVSEAEDASADKENRGRKRKSTALEADAPEPKAKKARISEPSEPWKAPVARMSEMQDVEDGNAARGVELRSV